MCYIDKRCIILGFDTYIEAAMLTKLHNRTEEPTITWRVMS